MTFLSVLMASNFSIENIKGMDMWAQGLFVVVAGLVGVFLVLSLFFLTIVLMQKISDFFGRKKTSKADQAEV